MKKGQGVKISTSKYHFRGQKWVLHTQSLGQIFIRDHQKKTIFGQIFLESTEFQLSMFHSTFQAQNFRKD